MATRRRRRRPAPWFRLVAVASAQTAWAPKWRLRINGDGMFLYPHFCSVREAVNYVQLEHPDSYVELPAYLAVTPEAR